MTQENIQEDARKNPRLDNIYVVMVEPKVAGNIGSAVRAMKNMGVSNLRLVTPCRYRDVAEQRKLGYRSQEIIEASEEFDTLEEALADISLTFLATSKSGKWKKDFVFPDKTGEMISQWPAEEKVAIVFGREDSGVTVEESQLCNYCVVVPTAVSYPSLNLSQAVLLVLYEIYKQCQKPAPPQLPRRANQRTYDRIFDNVWRLMKSLNFRETSDGLFYRSFKRCLNRTHWTTADVAVVDRVCKQARWFVLNRTKEDYIFTENDPYTEDAQSGRYVDKVPESEESSQESNQEKSQENSEKSSE